MTRFPMRALMGGAVTLALSAPAYGLCTATAAAGDPVRAPKPQTAADLAKAMRGEAFANVKYRLYAEQARREGLPRAARAFDRAADMELNEHFTESAGLSGTVGSDEANLRSAISGEGYEATTMYPRFARQARSAGDVNAAERFSEIAGDETKHRGEFATALGVVQTGQGTVSTPRKVTPVQVPAGSPQVRSAQTKADLDAAMHGEAEAYAKYTLWGRHAERQGDPAVARLFRGNAAIERQEHFAEEAQLAGLVGTTRENLANAISGERYESTTMYPEFARRARAAGDEEAARMFSHTGTDEAAHARAFQQARQELG